MFTFKLKQRLGTGAPMQDSLLQQEPLFSSLLHGDTWWTAQRYEDLQRRRLGLQNQDGHGLVDTALQSAAQCGARMLLRVQQQRWHWGPVSCSRDAAALLRQQTDDGRLAFVAHEYLVDPARHRRRDPVEIDYVWQRPFLDIEIEVPLLSRALAETVRTSPNDYIPLLSRCYVDAFREAFGLEPHCLWLTSHVFIDDETRSAVRKASFHMVVDTATRMADSAIQHVCFQRCSTQRAFVAQFERRLARMLFVDENWSAHDVDRVVPFVHAACTVVESAVADKQPKPWIDSGVYRPKHSMRMPLASKECGVLRPIVPLNFAIDNSDGSGGIEAACITGFDVDGALVLDTINMCAQQPGRDRDNRTDQCRAVLGALATSMSRLIGSFAADDDACALESLQPLLLAHRECEESLRLFLSREPIRAEQARAQQSTAEPETSAIVINMLALDSVLSRLCRLTSGFQAWCDEHSVVRVTRPATPLPFETCSTSDNSSSTACAGSLEKRDVSYEQQQYEWPIALGLATEHLSVQPDRVRLSAAYLWVNNKRGSTVASYYGETTNGAHWNCLICGRQHQRRKFRININQQTGVCVLRCDYKGDEWKRLDEVVSFAMQQCRPLGSASAPSDDSRLKRARFSPQ